MSVLKKAFRTLKSWKKRFRNTYGADISTPGGRRRAQIHTHLADYAFLRRYWTNMHPVSDGIWRSNQPGRDRFQRIADLGIKTIINLRGQTHYSTVLFEQEACEKQGIRLIHLDLNARKLATGGEYLHLLDLLEHERKPLLMHCKSGADRTGLAAAFYLLDQKSAPIPVARQQLSFRYLHRRHSATGILDRVLDEYEDFYRTDPIPIREWLKDHYDRNGITARFQASA